MNYCINYLRGIYKDKSIIIGLAKNDFKSRFASSFLGIVWAFVQPLVTILVMWYVFQVGFRNPPIDEYPFIVWFIPAYLSWSFFSDAFVNMTNSFEEYQYLLKQVNFRVSIIPLVKIISAAFVHLVFLVVILPVMMIYHMPITFNCLEVIYYFLCTVVLLLGLGWISATLKVFIPDVGSVVNVIVQIGFWATPICWNQNNVMNSTARFVLNLNPMNYICQGYRESYLTTDHFWNHPYQALLFWIITMIILLIGTVTFKRLRSYLVDQM